MRDRRLAVFFEPSVEKHSGTLSAAKPKQIRASGGDFNALY
jgi:hypothetical protein